MHLRHTLSILAVFVRNAGSSSCTHITAKEERNLRKGSEPSEAARTISGVLLRFQDAITAAETVGAVISSDENPDANLSLSWRTKSGVTFDRTVTEINGVGLKLDIDGYCEREDQYGKSDDCQVPWGPEVTGTLKLEASEIFDENDVFGADLTVNYFFPFDFECAVCGSPCVLPSPIDKTIDMPPCPLTTTTDIINNFCKILPEESPLDFPLYFSGTVYLKDYFEMDMTLKVKP